MLQEVEHRYADPLINVVLDTIKKNKQALIFVSSKRSAEKVALDVAKKIKDIDQSAFGHKVGTVLSSPTDQCKKLETTLAKGVAFHHSGVESQQRELIENGFRTGEVSIIACTPTLAAGVDLPAFRVIIRDLKRYTGSWGMQNIPVLEYQQMAGRAGRPGHEDWGEAICMVSNDVQKDDVIQTFLLGESEPIFSKLAVEPVLRTYVLSLIASQFVSDKSSLISFFEKTFWAHQYGDMHKLQSIMDRVVQLLIDYGFIQSKSAEQNSPFTSASNFFKNTEYQATRLGERVAQLYIDPLTANQLLEGLKNPVPENVFGYLQLICSTLEMRPLFNPKAKDSLALESALEEYKDTFLQDVGGWYEYDHQNTLASVKTALCLRDWTDEAGEDLIMQRYDVRPGELRAKLSQADWIVFCMVELARVAQMHAHAAPLSRLRTQLQYGVHKELLPLLKFKGIGRKRARIMFAAGIKDTKGIKETSIEKLSGILGDKTAANLKEQVNQDAEIFKKLTPQQMDEVETI